MISLLAAPVTNAQQRTDLFIYLLTSIDQSTVSRNTSLKLASVEPYIPNRFVTMCCQVRWQRAGGTGFCHHEAQHPLGLHFQGSCAAAAQGSCRQKGRHPHDGGPAALK